MHCKGLKAVTLIGVVALWNSVLYWLSSLSSRSHFAVSEDISNWLWQLIALVRLNSILEWSKNKNSAVWHCPEQIKKAMGKFNSANRKPAAESGIARFQ